MADGTGSKHIWVPKSELTVTVNGHDVQMVESMTMAPRPVRKSTGFVNG